MALKFKFNNSHRKLRLDEVLEALKSSGLLNDDQAKNIAQKSSRNKHHPLITIANFELSDRRNFKAKLNIDELTRWLAHYSQLDYLYIDPLKIEIDKITKVLPKAYVGRLKVLPISLDDHQIVIATAEPFELDWIDEVAGTTKKSVKVVVASPIQIESYLKEFYVVQAAVRRLSNEQELDKKYREQEVNQMRGHGSSALLGKNDQGISGIVDWLFQFAFNERATDIHMEPKQEAGIIRFRIDGTLREVYKFKPEVILPVLSRIKLMSGMKIDEKRRPQDGRIKRELGAGHTIEIRSSTIPTHYGEKLVLRIFDPKMADIGIDDLGIDASDLEMWKNLISHSHGMALVTGPTGSGKSTMLHASLKYLAKPEVNICTAEDPVEIINDSFNQMQINKQIDLTFANAIKAFLRQDPDIIMVGEIRDNETSDMAVQASLTGHMVFSTLHTNNALSAITRLLDLGVAPHLLNATLRTIMAQRLVRLLCPCCKEKVKTPANLWKSLVSPHKVKMPTHVYKAVGCNECKQSGYHGRACVYEMVTLTEKLRETITADVELRDLEIAAEGSFTPIRLNGAQRVIDEETSIEEILRVVV